MCKIWGGFWEEVIFDPVFEGGGRISMKDLEKLGKHCLDQVTKATSTVT